MQDYEKYMNDFPVIPSVASKIMAIAEDNIEISFKELERIISIDPMLTTKILKIANSALYARQSEIKNLQMAITLLGFKKIKSLVILLTASKFSRELKNREILAVFWRHSIATAFIAKYIMIRKKWRKDEETAFTAGLLHDIGQVALFQRYPEKYKVFLSDQSELGSLEQREQMEQSLFDTNHRILGGYILKKWNFPPVYVDTAEEHGSINVKSVYKNSIYAVTLADLITERTGFGQGGTFDESLIMTISEYLDLDNDDIMFLVNDSMTALGNDPLFQECQLLFEF